MNTKTDLTRQEPKEINEIRARIEKTNAKELIFPLVTEDDLISLRRIDTTYLNHVLEVFFTEKHLALKQSFLNFAATLGSNDESVMKLDKMRDFLLGNFANLKSHQPVLYAFLEKIEDRKNIIFFEIAKKYEEIENWDKVNEYREKISNDKKYQKYKNNFRIPA